jgi:hypothetical protein
MTCIAATRPRATAFERRLVALDAYVRAMWNVVVIGFGAVTAAGIAIGAVTVIAAWMMAGCFAGNPDLTARPPVALETMALASADARLAGAANLSSLVRVLLHAPDSPAGDGGEAVALADEPITTAALPPAAAGIPPQPAARPAEQAAFIPLPPRRPAAGPPIQVPHDIAAPPMTAALPQVAALTPAPATPASFSVLQKHAVSPQPPNDTIALPASDSHTALYDIEAHTVYLPDGTRLEAHSGLGNRLDDPRFVKEKARGPTPPNVYDLVLRGDLFHGVRAIRLNPVDDAKMFNRDGILAHPYMLGPNGQSFGCVSFKDYPEFLKAFEKGEIDRLVVVPHLDGKPPNDAHARREDAGRYAVNNP